MKQKINDCLPSNETILAFDKEKTILKWTMLKKQQEKQHLRQILAIGSRIGIIFS